jgi:hypothetical protein
MSGFMYGYTRWVRQDNDEDANDGDVDGQDNNNYVGREGVNKEALEHDEEEAPRRGEEDSGSGEDADT